MRGTKVAGYEGRNACSERLGSGHGMQLGVQLGVRVTCHLRILAKKLDLVNMTSPVLFVDAGGGGTCAAHC